MNILKILFMEVNYMRYRANVARITNYDLNYVLIPEIRGANIVLRLKCYLEEEKKSLKFTIPEGEERIKQFLTVVKAGRVSEIVDKEFQILYFEDRIYGISKIGEIEKVRYIPATPCEYGGKGVQNKMLEFSALMSFIAESTRIDRPYFIKME